MFDFKYIYNGSDDNSGYYNEKKEKQDRFREAGIWLALLIIFGGLLVFCISKNVGEIILKYNANSAIGSYSPDSSSISFVDGNDKTHVIYMPGAIVEHNGKQITLYYYNDDYASARYVTWPWFWVFTYIFFGSIFLLSLRFFIKNMKETHHYKGEQKKYTY